MKPISNLKVVKTGLGTSIQDLGRFGYSDLGVPYSGVQDSSPVAWINHLLRNQACTAVLEILQPGLHIVFEAPTLICLAGAKTTVSLNQISIAPHGLIPIQAGDALEIGKFEQGSILYLGIKNGFQTPKFLNSQSWHPSITPQYMLKKEDCLPYFSFDASAFESNVNVKWNFKVYDSLQIEVYPGPDWELLALCAQQTITQDMFTLSTLKNRMALQLEELIPNTIAELPTAPVFPGTVQLTAGGKILILLRDAQVTGGYPRILQLSESAISLISQKKPSQKIRFQFLKS